MRLRAEVFPDIRPFINKIIIKNKHLLLYICFNNCPCFNIIVPLSCRGLSCRNYQIDNIAKRCENIIPGCFYTLPFVADFIIEVLVGSPHSEIRDVALKQFYCLSQTVLTPGESAGHQQNPHHFMLQILLKARLPFWVCSSNTRGASYRSLLPCFKSLIHVSVM